MGIFKGKPLESAFGYFCQKTKVTQPRHDKVNLVLKYKNKANPSEASSVIYLFRIQIMMPKPKFCQLLIVAAGLPVITVGVNANPAPGRKFTPNLNVFGVKQPGQILHNNIGAILMKITVVPKAEQIQL